MSETEDEFTISPGKVVKQRERYFIEIPKAMLDTAKELHGKPVTVKIIVKKKDRKPATT